MLYGQDRSELRRYYLHVWEKAQANLPLEPLEQMIHDVIQQHPEYHGLFQTGGDDLAEPDYLPEVGQVNPFLHMGLHLAVHEQLVAGRPPGLREAYQQIAAKSGDIHTAEHRIMDCLAEALWQAQRDGTEPSEAAYLQCLKRLLA